MILVTNQPWPFPAIHEYQQVTQMTHSPSDQVLAVESLFLFCLLCTCLLLDLVGTLQRSCHARTGAAADFKICSYASTAKSFACSCFQWNHFVIVFLAIEWSTVSIYHGSIVSIVLQLDLVHAGSVAHTHKHTCFAFQLIANRFPDIFTVHDFGHQPWPLYGIHEYQQVTQMTHSPSDQVLAVESLFLFCLLCTCLLLDLVGTLQRSCHARTGAAADFKICSYASTAKSFACSCFQWNHFVIVFLAIEWSTVSIYHGSIVSIVLQLDLVHSGSGAHTRASNCPITFEPAAWTKSPNPTAFCFAAVRASFPTYFHGSCFQSDITDITIPAICGTLSI